MPPLVTVAIPLYRSKPFVQRIVENVRAIDVDDCEILISDRHLLDDAIDLLEKTLGNDPRVVFLRGTEGVGWTEHYNFLLGEGSGRYFMWMPHDDEFPSGYVPMLVAALEENEDALLAYGRMVCVDLEGRIVRRYSRSAPHDPDAAWSRRRAVEYLRWWQSAVPFRGVFRRQRIIDLGLWLPQSHGADISWLFALHLQGPSRFVPEVSCRKSFYSDSTTSRTKTGWSEIEEMARAMNASVRATVSDAGERQLLASAIGRWSLWCKTMQSGSWIARKLRLPQPLRATVRSMLERGRSR
jgi:hypothetical protein